MAHTLIIGCWPLIPLSHFPSIYHRAKNMHSEQWSDISLKYLSLCALYSISKTWKYLHITIHTSSGYAIATHPHAVCRIKVKCKHT